MLTKRRICWPNPDATCVEGGCSYCNDYPFRAVTTIYKYCQSKETLQNRGDLKYVPSLEAFSYGKRRNWNNAEAK